MSDIKIVFKDGTIKEFKNRGAPRRSWCNRIHYEGVFIIVEDPYGNKTSFPAENILEVYHETARRNW